MTTLREAAMCKALEYAEAQCGGRCNAEYNPCWAQEVADALRAALAQQVEQQPVAWMGAYDHTDLYYRKPQQADVIPLYTAAQAT